MSSKNKKSEVCIGGPKITPTLWENFKSGIIALDKEDMGILYLGTAKTPTAELDMVLCTEADYELELWATAITTEDYYSYTVGLVFYETNFILEFHPAVLEFLEEVWQSCPTNEEDRAYNEGLWSSLQPIMEIWESIKYLYQ